MSKDDELDQLATYFVGFAWSAFDNKNPNMVTDKFKEILKNYRHVDDIRSAVPEYRDNTDSKIPLPQTDDFISVGYNQAIDDITKALNIGDKDEN